MTSIRNTSTPVEIQQPVVVNNVPKQAKRLAFKAENDSFTKQNGPVYTQPPMLDQQAAMRRAIEEQKKAQKKQKAKQNLSWGLGIAVSVAFLAVLLPQVFGKGSTKKEMDSLTSTIIKWRDCNGQKRRTAELTAGTTHKNIKKQFDLIKDNKVLSEKAKEWAGIKEQADVFYVYGYGGTGKTYCTEQLAEDMNALYACVKYPDLGSPFKDAASMKVSNFFDNIIAVANKDPNRPVVVCIDESDALIQKVSEKALSEEAKKIRSAVITGIDNVTKNAKNVKLFLTSNYHPESGIVDDVVLRRVNKKLRVDLPDFEQADALTRMYLGSSKAVKPEFYDTPEYKDFIAKLITSGDDLGYSGGEISKIVEEAIKEFGATLKGVPDEELVKHAFGVEFLEKAMKTVGNPAARTNTTMFTAEERILLGL